MLPCICLHGGGEAGSRPRLHRRRPRRAARGCSATATRPPRELDGPGHRLAEAESSSSTWRAVFLAKLHLGGRFEADFFLGILLESFQNRVITLFSLGSLYCAPDLVDVVRPFSCYLFTSAKSKDSCRLLPPRLACMPSSAPSRAGPGGAWVVCVAAVVLVEVNK